MSELVSMRELARRLGVTLKTIQNHVAKGNIKPDKVEQRGKQTRIYFDPERAADEFHANRDPGQRQSETRGERAGDKEKLPAESGTFRKARSAREVFNAKMAELKFKKESGALVPIEDVKILFFNTGRDIQTNLLNIPARLAPILAAEMNEKKCFDLIKDEIVNVLEILSNARIDSLGK